MWLSANYTHFNILYKPKYNKYLSQSPSGSYKNDANEDNLTEFQVYGTITTKDSKTANIFAGETVSKNLTSGTGDEWKYDAANTQYWIPGNTYNFVAIADGNTADGATSVSTDDYGMPTAIKLFDATKTHDILYAEQKNITDTNGFPSSVEFTFNHIMAKAKVTVKNTIETNSGYSYKVSDITLNKTPKSGIYDIATGTWSEADDPVVTYNCRFGNATAAVNAADAPADFIGFNKSLESNFERLIVPTFDDGNDATDDVTNISITFTRDYYYSSDGGTTNVLVRSEQNTVSTKKKIEAGHAYNFVIKLGNPGEPIKFTVESITDWDYNHDGYNPGVDVK